MVLGGCCCANTNGPRASRASAVRVQRLACSDQRIAATGLVTVFSTRRRRALSQAKILLARIFCPLVRGGIYSLSGVIRVGPCMRLGSTTEGINVSLLSIMVAL